MLTNAKLPAPLDFSSDSAAPGAALAVMACDPVVASFVDVADSVGGVAMPMVMAPPAPASVSDSAADTASKRALGSSASGSAITNDDVIAAPLPPPVDVDPPPPLLETDTPPPTFAAY